MIRHREKVCPDFEWKLAQMLPTSGKLANYRLTQEIKGPVPRSHPSTWSDPLGASSGEVGSLAGRHDEEKREASSFPWLIWSCNGSGNAVEMNPSPCCLL